jgi:SAM-dependent methyltransferase
LTESILDHANPNMVTGVDPSAGFVEYTKARVTSRRATVDVADAQSLPFERGAFDVAVAGLVLNFVAEPRLAAAEMARVVRSGGVVAAYVWDYAGKMELMRYFWDAAVALDPAARDLDEGRRFPLCQPKPLTELFAQAGLADVEVQPFDIPTDFVDFDDYWRPFLGGQGPAPGYAMSLDEARRGALRELLRALLPVTKNGALHLVARAWAVRGRAP